MLVTFAIITFNQQNYIKEAIESAFRQKYSPLEIIIIDDHSTDNTFQIIEDLARQYKGPHTIKYSRNTINIGISAQINNLNAAANGEIIVIAAGDDISFPDRSTKIVDEYLKSNKKSHYFYSRVCEIDENGKTLGLTQSPGGANAHSILLTGLSHYPLAIGAGQAWTKFLVKSFKPMLPSVWAEDQIFGFRGVLMGPVTFIEDALVKYRIGTGISTKNKKFNPIRYFKEKHMHTTIIFQRALDAFFFKKYTLASILFINSVFSLITTPISPLISILNKVRNSNFLKK